MDPILLIHRIKEGMEIPNLRDSLVKILQDYNLQVLMSFVIINEFFNTFKQWINLTITLTNFLFVFRFFSGKAVRRSWWLIPSRCSRRCTGHRRGECGSMVCELDI